MGVCHLHTLIFMSARQSRGDASLSLSVRGAGMLGTLKVAGARGSEAEFNLVKHTAIMSVRRQRNNSLSGAKDVTCNWDVRAWPTVVAAALQSPPHTVLSL